MARFRPRHLFRRLSSRGDPDNPRQPPSPPPSTAPSSTSPSPARAPAYSTPPRRPRKSSSLPKLRRRSAAAAVQEPEPEVPEVPAVVKRDGDSIVLVSRSGGEERRLPEDEPQPRRSGSETLAGGRSREELAVDSEAEKEPEVSAQELKLEEVDSLRRQPVVVVEHPTPDAVQEVAEISEPSAESSQQPSPEDPSSTSCNLAPHSAGRPDETEIRDDVETSRDSPSAASTKKSTRPSDTNVRRPSIVDSANAKIVKTLIDSPLRHAVLPTSASSVPPTEASPDYFSPGFHNMAAILHRKIWVKRPGASATLVQIREDDLVDDVRDMILRKYANSLGKTFDAPDVTLSIFTRPENGANKTERVLGPEEEMCRTLDSHYPGGQTVDEALHINVPQRRTPRPSPKVFQHHSYHALDDYRPLENGTDYFPPMPAFVPSTLPQTAGSDHSRSSTHGSTHHHASISAVPPDHPRSISVLNTGQIPPLPSPGGTSRRHQHRPKYLRQPTSSPTIISHPTAGAVAVNPPPVVHRQSTRPRMDSSASEAHHPPNGIAPVPPPLPTPPAPEAPPTNKNNSQPPTPSGTTHRPARPRKTRKEAKPTSRVRNGSRAPGESSSSNTAGPLGGYGGLLDGSVPPINVLIVEDNVINLRILEGLMKRLKVRWQTAVNGQIAVDKWKAGGFHLVLMDIQMPIMNGLQATREIRRLERVNGIGAFSEATTPDREEHEHAEGDSSKAKSKEDDKLHMSEGLFKSPIIIVALTASSLQSDRHEALAAGCNDFLTKPVNFVWLERKVKEWGCMQALIDFDGWRKWKDYAAQQEASKTEEEKQKEREKEEKDRVRAEKMAKLQEKQAKLKEEKERKKRQSLNASEAGAVTNAKDGEVLNGATTTTPTAASATQQPLKPGAEVLGESNFDLAG